MKADKEAARRIKQAQQSFDRKTVARRAPKLTWWQKILGVFRQRA